MLRLRNTIRQARHLHSQQQVGANSLNYKHVRAMALFQGKQEQGDRKFTLDLPKLYTKQRQHEHIQGDLAYYQNNIENKQKQGLGLAKQVSESAEQDKYKKIQRYEIFIDKMTRLYKSEIRFKNKQLRKLQQQRNSILYSLTPLKDILRNYNDLTVQGFNSEAALKTLQNLSSTLRARGYKARVMGDYTISELDQSWRMQKLVDDLTFGLRKDQFFSPYHLALISQELGRMGYKNTQLIPQIFEKINSQLDERQLGISYEQKELDFKDVIYGGPRNFIPRHYVYKGFQNNEEFNEYLSILLEWETESGTLNKSNDKLSQEAKELEREIGAVIKASMQVKNLQKEYQISIENLRTQYFQMLEAQDKHQFLQENQYIKYDLLELQEMLVKGGYLAPEEASQHLSQEPFGDKMKRAADVFYDYVQNYAPELLSPQHTSFFEAAANLIPEKPAVNINKKFKENQNIINLSSLSQILAGLSQQALSFRRDVNDMDYLSKFYEQYLMPEETAPSYQRPDYLNKMKHQTVLMERCYLRAWKTFKEETAKIIPRFLELVNEDKKSLPGQLDAIWALTQIRYDQPEVRESLVKNALDMISKSGTEVEQTHVINGLKGLAESSTLSEEGKQLANQLEKRIKSKELQFEGMIDTAWSLCALQLYESKHLSKIVKRINELNFERIDHDLKYDEYIKLLDIHNALRFEGHTDFQFNNKNLVIALNSKESILGGRFVEELTKYDPFKRRVLQALAKGLTDASIDHQVILENELYQALTLDADVLNERIYPYRPDLMMGFKGQKVGIFVLSEIDSTQDTKKPLGQTLFRQRLLKSANRTVQTASIAVHDVVNYDIENFQLSLNSTFNFSSLLESQLKEVSSKFLEIDFSELSKFGIKMIEKMEEQIEKLPPTSRDPDRLAGFAKKIHELLMLKQQTEVRFDQSQKNVGYDMLKLNMMKLNLIYQTLTPESQQFVNKHIDHPSGFPGLLKKVHSQVPVVEKYERIDRHLDSNWLGTRMEVELPVSATDSEGQKVVKNIAPEILNQRFLWVDDYFHYEDWKQKQKETFDNFNLIVLPLNENDPKYFFDKDNYNRRIPQGIFPNPNARRQIMLPPIDKVEQELTNKKNHDEYVLFEKDPFKMMVLAELKKAETLKPISEDVSMITNLQNIKQGLKANYSDKELLQMILLNLNFTDKLIEEHLQGGVQRHKDSKIRYVPRSSENYRRFVEQTYTSKDREDPYSHFYLKEAEKKERIYKVLEQEKQVQKLKYENTESSETVEEGQQRQEKLQEKIENLLLKNEMENEDYLNISSALKQSVQINYDLKSLLKSEFIYDMDPDLVDKGLSHDEYLDLSRRRAESKLIKTKIIYKVYNNHQLSPQEKTYLKTWLNEIQNEKTNLFNLRDTLLPQYATSLTFGDVEAKNFYTLNSINNVEIERDKHGKYAINDLILELSHFLDEDVVNKVETEILSQKIKHEWKLSNDFKLIETRNKEIGMVINELEEIAWRTAGMINEKDLSYLKRMFAIKRNKDSFDKVFYEIDMKSLDDFLKTANLHDNRIQLLEKWAARKEEEIEKRVQLPPAHLQKSDTELYAKFDAPLKRARERMVARLLMVDRDNNPIPEKEYKDLTSKELHYLVENICLRFYLFNYNYPPFLPQCVKAIMEHPNLLRGDKDQMDTYTKIFELDWQGDRDYNNKQEFMYSHPIYPTGSNLKSYADVDNNFVKEKLMKACAPYVEEAAVKLQNLAA